MSVKAKVSRDFGANRTMMTIPVKPRIGLISKVVTNKSAAIQRRLGLQRINEWCLVLNKQFGEAETGRSKYLILASRQMSVNN